jgi:mannitol/fructose-specific phosphotransferase system IIA component
MRKDSVPPRRPARRLLGQVLVDGGFVSPGDLARALEQQNRTSEMLGKVLVDGGFVSPGDLSRALEEQNRTNEMLGEVLVRMKVVDPAEIAAVVSIQSDLLSLEDAVRSAAGVRQYLGELLLKARKVTPEQLKDALSEQRQSGEKLGEILVRRGALTKGQLDAVLMFQKCQAGEAPSSVRFRLGEILVATGRITREQLEDVLSRQKLTKKNIGDLLVESGAVAPRHVARGLRLQEMLVTAALVAVVSLADVAAAQEMPGGGTGPATGSARIQVTATVPARAALRVLHQARMLVVTPEDVARGYVDAPAASRIEVRNNSRGGCLLVFERIAGPDASFGKVSVRGFGRDVEIGPGGGFVPHSYASVPVTAELSYRFSLDRDARPGTYPWPLQVSVRPL